MSRRPLFSMDLRNNDDSLAMVLASQTRPSHMRLAYATIALFMLHISQTLEVCLVSARCLADQEHYFESPLKFYMKML